MPNIGPVELVIILVIALLVIGPGKLPDVGSALGKSIREFRKAATDVQESVKLDAPIAPAVPAPAAPAPVVAPAVVAAVPALAPPAPVAPAVPAPAAPAPVVAPAVPAPPEPNTLAAAATPNELSAPAAPDPAATAAEAATEARV
jgi:TatA/E family protein of Tat protein translocase